MAGLLDVLCHFLAILDGSKAVILTLSAFLCWKQFFWTVKGLT